jgi:hypothetical protein
MEEATPASPLLLAKGFNPDGREGLAPALVDSTDTVDGSAGAAKGLLPTLARPLAEPARDSGGDDEGRRVDESEARRTGGGDGRGAAGATGGTTGATSTGGAAVASASSSSPAARCRNDMERE